MGKITVFLLLLFPVLLPAQEKKSFVIKGRIQHSTLPVQKVIVSYQENGENKTDSATIINNEYTLSGKIFEPVLVSLRVQYDPASKNSPAIPRLNRDFALVFLDTGTSLLLSDTVFANITIKGSHANEEYRKLTALEKPLLDERRNLMEDIIIAKRKMDTIRIAAIEKKRDSLLQATRTIEKQYLRANPTSPIAIYALTELIDWETWYEDHEEVRSLFNSLPAATRTGMSAKQIANLFEISDKTLVGQPAMEFTQNDTSGVPVRLSSFRGKYVLVDFWASWCGPCRAENPNLIKAYERFRSKNFSVLSVSLDKPGDHAKWLEAIHHDQLNWTHVSDLKGWENTVARQYGIFLIPQNLLIDPEGKIVAKNLYGDAILKKLTTLITN